MEIVIVPDAATIGELAADAVVALLARKPTAVLGLATGSSPLVVYAELIRRYDAGEVSFARSRGFLLDEYVGLPAEHPQRYRSVIRRELEERVDFPADAIAGPDGLADDLPAVCADYERAITDAGGVDLQLLGVGSDGHVAFNEPGSSLSSRTRIKTLTARTRADNERFFEPPDEVPHHVLTQGLGHHPRRAAPRAASRGAPARRRPCTSWSRARCPRSARPQCCSCTRTRPFCWTTTRLASSSSPTTTGRRTPTSPTGRGCRAATVRIELLRRFRGLRG